MTLLLLAGTGEAKDIAQKLAEAGIPAIASLAGATRAPKPLAIAMRVGGFGGEDGFRAYLQEAEITAVLDATHPFAAAMTARTAAVCHDIGLPYLHFLRPGWTAEAGDNWTDIDREENAAHYVKAGQTVFLGTGRQTLERFANLEGVEVICRQIDPPSRPFPFLGGRFLVGRPPFPVADEKTLFSHLQIDWLIVKNAGGERSRTKLIAARQLGIPVLMIKRPPMPVAERVATIADAVAWAQTI